MTSVSDGKIAAAMAPGRTLPLEGSHSRPLAGDENQPLKPKSRRPGAQVALTVPSAEKPSLATTTSVPTTAATCPPTPHQRAAAAPKAHRQVLTPVLATRTRMGPSQNTSTALAAYDMLCDPSVQPATVARTEDGMLHPGQAAAVRLPLHGWRTPPSQSWRMSSSPGCRRKKRVAGPRGGRPRLAPPSSPARRLSPLASSGVTDKVFTNVIRGPPPTTRGLGPTRHAS
jgi:hypothetical protein